MILSESTSRFALAAGFDNANHAVRGGGPLARLLVPPEIVWLKRWIVERTFVAGMKTGPVVILWCPVMFRIHLR